MNRLYRLGNDRYVDEYGLERIYQSLDELRSRNLYSFEYFYALTCCMEEVAKRSKRLKRLVEKNKMEADKEKEVKNDD